MCHNLSNLEREDYNEHEIKVWYNPDYP